MPDPPVKTAAASSSPLALIPTYEHADGVDYQRLTTFALLSLAVSGDSCTGEPLSRYRSGRLMKESSLVSCQQPKHRYKRAVSEHLAIPNKLNREFNVTKPNQV